MASSIPASVPTDVGPLPVGYLNRLSDALFVWGRWCALKDGREEPLWDSRAT